METMRKTLGKYVLRTSALALTCLALAGSNVKAAALHTYSTTGSVDATTATVTGTPDITFASVQSGSFNAPSAAGLGSFQVAQGVDGTSTTYDNTPFSIIYNPLTINGVSTTTAPIMISGMLNGTISTDMNGNQSSSVVATFNPIGSPVFSTPSGKFLSTLSLTDSPLSLVPYSAGGMTTVQANVITTGPVAAPEPTTMAILATSLVGLGLRQKLRSGRKAS
jgi:hypothetical protein